MSVSAGTVVGNRYEILRPLGRGASGEVYEVRDHHQDHLVALKLLDPTVVGPWPWHEATQLTRLRSEYILRVWNADVVAGVPYIVTELATSGTVADVLLAQGPFSPGEAVKAIRHASRGAARTHDDRIVHRDIKLENLFVGENGHVLLGDFGLAHPMDASRTAPMAGTPAKMAPEVLAGGRTSPSSDIYSLGASLYRLLCGQGPYYAALHDIGALQAA